MYPGTNSPFLEGKPTRAYIGKYSVVSVCETKCFQTFDITVVLTGVTLSCPLVVNWLFNLDMGSYGL